MAHFHSFEPHLKQLCERLKPLAVLEWGPGRSTEVLLEHSSAIIFSIEHDEHYFSECQKKFAGNPRVQLIRQPLEVRPGGSHAYVTFPLYTQVVFDLVFVDGRLRCDCLAVASLVVKPEGAVVLHDAERKNYHSAFRFFERVENRQGTAILTRPLFRIAPNGPPSSGGAAPKS